MLGFNWIIGIGATTGAFILRKKGKTKASIWVNVIGLGYILILFAINYITELL